MAFLAVLTFFIVGILGVVAAIIQIVKYYKRKQEAGELVKELEAERELNRDEDFIEK